MKPHLSLDDMVRMIKSHKPRFMKVKLKPKTCVECGSTLIVQLYNRKQYCNNCLDNMFGDISDEARDVMLSESECNE